MWSHSQGGEVHRLPFAILHLWWCVISRRSRRAALFREPEASSRSGSLSHMSLCPFTFAVPPGRFAVGDLGVELRPMELIRPERWESQCLRWNRRQRNPLRAAWRRLHYLTLRAGVAAIASLACDRATRSLHRLPPESTWFRGAACLRPGSFAAVSISRVLTVRKSLRIVAA